MTEPADRDGVLSPQEQATSCRTWRVGTRYPIHVYEGDRPVATFFTAADAKAAVKAYNDALEAPS